MSVGEVSVGEVSTANELGLFLRTRRDALTPGRAGLPAGPRRRAPGLRRSEVAALADISVEYLTRLEQGRDRSPSPVVLARLSDALQLTTAERVHLHRLAKSADGHFRCRAEDRPSQEVRAGVRALLDGLEPAAAAVLNRLGDVVAHTAGYRRLMAPLGLFDEPADGRPNLPRFVLADPRAREAYPDWDAVADQQVATLKQGPFLADPATAALAAELTVTAGAAFTGRVETVPGLPAASGVVRLRHPVSPAPPPTPTSAGELRLAQERLDLPADDDQHLVVHLPADAATAAALARLAQADGLRLVSG